MMVLKIGLEEGYKGKKGFQTEDKRKRVKRVGKIIYDAGWNREPRHLRTKIIPRISPINRMSLKFLERDLLSSNCLIPGTTEELLRWSAVWIILATSYANFRRRKSSATPDTMI